ncbi:MAG: phage replisome organizer N-terminal domain-containing protein [Chloroflexi bacterium]|nr:phage replisome organizer N-terminal domain-containing protein [Chloroflexota bacterium]
MSSRTWIKVYCDKWLTGTLREDAPDVRGVWIDLLTFAGGGQYGDTGEIKLTNGVGFTDSQIATILHIPKSLWRKAKARLLETGRIEISPRGAIRIVKWSKYQSEYNRQKKYRQPKEGTSTPEPESPFTNPLENEKEIESKKLQPEVTTKGYNEKLQNFGSSYSQGANPPATHLPGKDGQLRKDNAISYRRGCKETWKTRIADYLQKHGPSRPADIATGLGLPEAKYYLVSMTLSQNNGRVFTNPQRGKWALKDGE